MDTCGEEPTKWIDKALISTKYYFNVTKGGLLVTICLF
jgi:hypothetical protein